MIKLHIIDTIIILTYLIFIFFIGIRIWQKEKTNEISWFLLAGRQLTIPSFVATLVSSWYGGILGVGEFSYRYGISNWLVFGVPYYIAAAIFAIFFAKKAQSLQLYTIPQQLEIAYGKGVSIIGSFFVFIITVPAAYILMLAVLLKFLFSIPLLWGLIIATIASTGYVLIGGFQSVVKTNIVQFILMFLSFLILLPAAVLKYGGVNYLDSNLPSNHLVWHGGMGGQYIIVWFFIALVTLIDASFYQRCFAAKSGKVAQRGILISILFWILFDFLTTFSGLYAKAILPNLQDPVTSYLALAQKLLPPIFQGLFFTGLLATIMSTIDSYAFLAAMTFGRDFWWRLKNESSTEYINKYTRIGLIVSGVLAIVIGHFAQSVIRIWKDIGSVATPALVVPLAASFFPKFKMKKSCALISIIVSASISGVWIFSKSFNNGIYLLGIEPIYPGLGFSLLMLLGNNLIDRARKNRLEF